VAGKRVIVAVSPPLLADALCRALAQDGMTVSTVDEVPLPDQPYDVAVVTPGREQEVRAAHVVTVPAEGSGAAGPTSLALLREAVARLV